MSVDALLQVDDIYCHYGPDVAVRGTSFSLEKGQLACLLGPSGCGKTSVLRAIAGFQTLQRGCIRLNGECVSDTRGSLPPEQRQLSMMFQDHALFPHLSAEKNVAAGLFRHGAREKHRLVMSVLERVGLSGYAKRYPHELSGGQQQRVALARALAANPVLLLMDEPYSSLDLELRTRLGQEIRDLLKEIGTTCLMVTHNQQDAFIFAEQVGVMRDGHIEQWDTPYNLYHQPHCRFVAGFVGDGVFIAGTVTSRTTIETELAVLSGDFPAHFAVGQAVQVLVRPDDIVHDDNSPQSAKIKKRIFRGESYLYTLVLPSGHEILSTVPSHHNHAIGEGLGITLEIDHLVVFPALAGGA